MSPRAGIDPLQTTEVTKRVVFVGYTPPHQGSPAAPGAWREEAAPGGLPPSFAKSDSPVHCWETAEGRGGPAASAPGSGGCERKWVGGHVTRVPEENDQVPRVSGTLKPFPTSTFWAPERLSARHPPKWGRRVCVEANRTVRSGPPGGPLAGAGVVRGAGGRDPRGGGCGRVGAGLAGRSRDGTTAAPPGEPFPPVGWAPRAAAGVVLRGPGRRRGVASWRAGGLGRRGRPATGIECGSPEPGRRASARGPGP
ncbi:hypothetical protein NUU61_005856 [Penicillium alfredii]|uniref:Uncharacterized protein n=1 Tax=Penicillium alfredii TaxID=1506179 RepID=A0A9W9FA69_9EURO|nr:hypothetical protein NUU61_005856 [Penicillium alfredii]